MIRIGLVNSQSNVGNDRTTKTIRNGSGEMNYEDVITLIDEEGIEQDFVIVDVIDVDEQRYAILVPQEDDQEDAEARILRIDVNDNGEEVLVDIEDDDEFDRVIEALDELDDDDIYFDDDEEEDDDDEF